MKKNYLSIGIVLVAIVVALLIVSSNKSVQLQTLDPNFGSIQDGQAYAATTTAAGDWGATTNRMLKVGFGTLGSVVITGATGGGTIELRNATSTIDPASTTLAKFTAGAIGGTYTFDVAFSRGLAIITQSGVTATTTITWR